MEQTNAPIDCLLPPDMFPLLTIEAVVSLLPGSRSVPSRSVPVPVLPPDMTHVSPGTVAQRQSLDEWLLQSAKGLQIFLFLKYSELDRSLDS